MTTAEKKAEAGYEKNVPDTSRQRCVFCTFHDDTPGINRPISRCSKLRVSVAYDGICKYFEDNGQWLEWIPKHWTYKP